MTTDTLPTLRAELRKKALHRIDIYRGKHIQVHANEILDLLDHIDALEIEARMYRYLRDEAHPDSNSGIFVASKELGDWGKWYEKHHTGKPLDETIAAALAEQGEPK